jgi:hypothetical protein
LEISGVLRVGAEKAFFDKAFDDEPEDSQAEKRDTGGRVGMQDYPQVTEEKTRVDGGRIRSDKCQKSKKRVRRDARRRAPGNHRPNEDAKVNDYNNARQIEAGSADSQIQRDQEGQTGKHGDGLVDPWGHEKTERRWNERRFWVQPRKMGMSDSGFGRKIGGLLQNVRYL